MDSDELSKAINDSGFPLQLGLQRSVASAPNWKILISEHAWLDPLTRDEKFIDFVVADKTGHLNLIVECKRAKDTQWIFLRETSADTGNNARTIVRARVASLKPNKPTIDDWVNVQCVPGSPIATYCVVRKNNLRTQELLERTAAEVVRATDAFAAQELAILYRTRQRTNTVQGIGRLYIPIIVTTAQLFVCDADYAKQFDLQTGEVAGPSAEQVSIVRFAKSLGTGHVEKTLTSSIKDFADENERSVLIVHAPAFKTSFLERLNVSKNTDQTLLEGIFT